MGCYLTATETLDRLPAGELFWHLYEYPTRAAADAAKLPMGPPMVLTGMGTEMRRSVVLVLHDTRAPWMTIATDWKPAKSCVL